MEEKNLSAPQAEIMPAAPEEPAKKTGLMRGARDFIENTFNSLKGKDMNLAVEEFTSDMTLVIEGLSEDLNALQRAEEKLSAQMTILEDRVDAADDALKADILALRRDLDDMSKRIKTLEKPGKKEMKPGAAALLRQITWIVGIFCSAWVIVTLLKFIGG